MEGGEGGLEGIDRTYILKTLIFDQMLLCKKKVLLCRLSAF